MGTLRFELEYNWEPFTVTGQQLTFAQIGKMKLFPNECSHWRAAIYKWEGILMRGPNIGKLGILFGETDDISLRIQQYATATHQSREYYERQEFLLLGDVRLFIFKPQKTTIDMKEPKSIFENSRSFAVKDRRTMIKELLVIHQVLQQQPYIVLMNREF